MIGFAFCSLKPDPLEVSVDPGRLKTLGDLDYYSPALHRAAFVLPRRFLDLLPGKSQLDKGPIVNRHEIVL